MSLWKSIAVLALVAACGPTPYQPMGSDGGYAEEKLGARSYRVVVKINRQTDIAKAGIYLARRASELCGGKYMHGDVVRLDDGYEVGTTIRCGEDEPRPSRLDVVAAVDGISVSLRPVGYRAWELRIANTRQAGVLVAWDESSYVVDGESWGRLIRGETRKIDTANMQPASPVAAGAMLRQIVFPERFTETTDDEDTSDLPLKRFLEYGTINLVIVSGETRETWQGSITD